MPETLTIDGVTHTVLRATGLGEMESHCGVTGGASVSRKHDTPCGDCIQGRMVTESYPPGAWDTSTDYGPRS